MKDYSNLYSLSFDDLSDFISETESPELLSFLAQDPRTNFKHLLQIATSDFTPPSVLDDLAHKYSDSDEMLENISNHGLTELKTLRYILTLDSPDAHANIARNSHLTRDMVETLLEMYPPTFENDDYVDILKNLAQNRKTPQDVLRTLYDSELKYKFNSELLKNSNTPPEILKSLFIRLGYDSYYDLALNKNTPSNILRDIYKRQSSTGWALIINPSTPQDVLKDIYAKGTLGPREFFNFAANPSTPSEVLEDIFNRKENGEINLPAGFIQELLRNPNTPKDLREKIRIKYVESLKGNLANTEKIPRIDYGSKFESSLKGRVNSDLELLKRLKSYIRDKD